MLAFFEQADGNGINARFARRVKNRTFASLISGIVAASLAKRYYAAANTNGKVVAHFAFDEIGINRQHVGT